MPTYIWHCTAPLGDCNTDTWEQWRSIHDDTPGECPGCGSYGVQVFTPPRISVYATPHKGADARRVDRTEAGWDKDLPSYKAMRRQGLHPKNIDGCHRLEGDAKIPMELEMGRSFRNDEERSVALDTQAELRDNQDNMESILPQLREGSRKQKAGV